MSYRFVRERQSGGIFFIHQHFPFLEIILQRQMRFRISDFCASDKKTGDFTEKVTVSPCIIPKNRIFCNFFEGKLVGIK